MRKGSIYNLHWSLDVSGPAAREISLLLSKVSEFKFVLNLENEGTRLRELCAAKWYSAPSAYMRCSCYSGAKLIGAGLVEMVAECLGYCLTSADSTTIW